MPVAELARRIPVKENKRAEGSVSAAPIFGKKEVNGEGSSMPKDIGSLATINLSSLQTRTEITSGPPSDHDGLCKSWAGGCNNVLREAQSDKQVVVELFAPLDTRSLQTRTGEQAKTTDVDGSCRTIQGVCPSSGSVNKDTSAKDGSQNPFDLKVSGLDTKLDTNNTQLDFGPSDDCSRACSNGCYSSNCGG